MEFNPPALRTPTDVLAAVPYLLGYQPTDSVVLLGLRARKVVFQVRADLPTPGDRAALVTHVCEVVARQRVTTALIVGYGEVDAVTPAVEALRAGLSRRGIRVLEVLRASGGRYWSYLCRRSECCPPEGIAYDTSTTSVAASATVAGISPAASRDDLVARLAPPSGDRLSEARGATGRAARRLAELWAGAGNGRAGDAAVLAAGRRALDGALGGTAALSGPDEIAWLAALLTDTRVRDLAWRRIDEDKQLHLDLWTEVVRRVDPALAAAPASLLAFAAWQLGEGALASIALDRADAAQPGYPMAALLGTALHHGLPPSSWREPPPSTRGRAVRHERPPGGGAGGRRRRVRS
jgi:hypothetical protein